MSFPLSPLPCPSAAMAAGCPDLFLNGFLIHFLILSPLSSNASCTVLPLKSFTPLILSLSHSVVCRVHQIKCKILKINFKLCPHLYLLSPISLSNLTCHCTLSRITLFSISWTCSLFSFSRPSTFNLYTCAHCSRHLAFTLSSGSNPRHS